MLYEVPSCDVRLPIEKLKLGVFVFAKLRSCICIFFKKPINNNYEIRSKKREQKLQSVG